jgi:TetR/AcrR family transcriptional repressor of nem operon
MSKLKAEQKERTRGTIIGSACKLLRERGIGGARVADVMSGAGLTVGGFYAHFASKEALVDEALRRTARAMRDRLFDRIEDKPLHARAEVVLKRYLSAAHRDDAANGCPLPAVVGEVSTTTPEHRDVLAEQISELADQLAAQIPKGDSKRAFALGMIALMYGGISLARAVKGTELSDEILRSCRAFGRTERAAGSGSEPLARNETER